MRVPDGIWKAPDLASSPAREFTHAGRIGAVATLLLASGFQLAAFVTEPAHPETIDRVHWIAENPDRADLAKTFDFLAVPFLFGTVVVYVLLSRARSRRLAYVAGILLLGGMVGLAAAQGYEVLQFKLAQDGRFDLNALADVVDESSPPLIAMFLLFLPGVSFGLLTMTVALWRSRAVPRGAVILIPVFMALDLPLQQGLAAHAVAFVGACWIASAVVAAGRYAAAAREAALAT